MNSALYGFCLLIFLYIVIIIFITTCNASSYFLIVCHLQPNKVIQKVCLKLESLHIYF